MRKQPSARRWPAAVILAFGTGASAADSHCFDFSRPVTSPLRPSLPPSSEGTDVHAFGSHPNGLDWAAGRATLDLPIEAVYRKILEHRSLKDMSKTSLARIAEDRPGFLAFQYVDVLVRVRVLLVRLKIAWREAWGFAVARGTAGAPREIVAAYEKISGTRHIRHLCGSYVLSALDGGRTELSFYEEVDAARRSAEDTCNMHKGILRNLRKPRGT